MRLSLAATDRVRTAFGAELAGFIELVWERGEAAFKKWGVPWMNKHSVPWDACWSQFDGVDIVSICTQPEKRADVFASLPESVKGVWCEKPLGMTVMPPDRFKVQVNYQRRADPLHQLLAASGTVKKIVAYGKDDETTRCHFRDLSRFWGAPLDYRSFDGPCAYIAEKHIGSVRSVDWFDNGGVNSAECFKGMLGNLLDSVEGTADLFSPPYLENA
jgi:hypothetical protein